ncbi:hypothetical protein N7931_00725 [Catenovulum sp. 2E275]|uniref:hypothetical protein n=1 Tax=Catenovulum sp. 2E275 TaxID=2980497 RepID=UPI0021D3C8C2|nr:hypothetical protein [Catenovulum sp. 2E275]MCU4674145.1 hypothetical protein [Catenovulum sp. 2E275]
MRLRFFISIICLLISAKLNAVESNKEPDVVIIPYMDVPATHRLFGRELLALALKLSEDKFGPYQLRIQTKESVIKRQLYELQTGHLSVATSMPTQDWLTQAQIIQIPIMRGLASYRLFFAYQEELELLSNIQRDDQLKQVLIGQGNGWSTSELLLNNGYQVVFSTKLDSLFKMLKAKRFNLLMRSVYEVEAEYAFYKPMMPELEVVKNFAVFTYLPMYFFVAKNSPLQSRLTYGLNRAYQTGEADKLFKKYYAKTLEYLSWPDIKIIYLTNSNISCDLYQQDKAYLLEQIKQMADNSNVSLGNCKNEK